MTVSTETTPLTRSLGGPWPRMAIVRATWLRHRAALISLFVLFVACALVIARGALGIHSEYANYLAAGCTTANPNDLAVCPNISNSFANGTVGFTALVIALRVFPVIVGLFVGAPLLSRDLESGTFRFAWTQGMGRVRYVFSTFAILAMFVTTTACILGLLLGGWYAHNFSVVNPNIESHWQSGLFDTTGFLLATWTLFALTLGTFCGAIIKRTVAAMAVTVALVGGLLVASSVFLLRFLDIGAVVTSRFPIRGINTGTLNYSPQDRPSVWLLRGWLTGPNGRALSSGAANRVQQKALQSTDPGQWLSLHHDTFWVSYQTADRFWIYQGAEGVVLIGIAVALCLATVRVVRAGRA